MTARSTHHSRQNQILDNSAATDTMASHPTERQMLRTCFVLKNMKGVLRGFLSEVGSTTYWTMKIFVSLTWSHKSRPRRSNPLSGMSAAELTRRCPPGSTLLSNLGGFCGRQSRLYPARWLCRLPWQHLGRRITWISIYQQEK